MNGFILEALRNRLGRAQRVINALDASDTDSTAKAATVDARARVTHSLAGVQGQTIAIAAEPSDENQFLFNEDGFVSVSGFGKTERSAIRIRDAIRKEMNDMTQPFPPLDASVGRFEHMRYTGDGALSFDPVTQLFQAEGTVRIIVQYA